MGSIYVNLKVYRKKWHYMFLKTHINLRMYIKHIKVVTCLGVEYDNKKKSV